MGDKVDDLVKALGGFGKPAPKKASARREWRAVAGQYLEYGDSGFIIKLTNNRKKPPYVLIDPEGREMPAGDNLDMMQKYAEEQSKYRDLFNQGLPDVDLSRFNNAGETE